MARGLFQKSVEKLCSLTVDKVVFLEGHIHPGNVLDAKYYKAVK